MVVSLGKTQEVEHGGHPLSTSTTLVSKATIWMTEKGKQLATSKARKKKEGTRGETLLLARREGKIEVVVEEPDKEPDKYIHYYEQLYVWGATKEDVIFWMQVNMCTYQKRIFHPITFEGNSCNIR